MADNSPKEAEMNNERKRPLKENNDTTLTPPRPAVAGSMAGKLKTPIRTNPYSSAKKKPKPGGDDGGGGDVEVLSPPPRPVSSDGNSNHSLLLQQPQEPGSANTKDSSDDCVVEWSNATNPLVDFPHGRPDCGVHPFGDDNSKFKFCGKCYCLVCNNPASECPQWQEHCLEAKQSKRSAAGQPNNQAEDVIDIEDSSPEQPQPQQQQQRLQENTNRRRVPPQVSINPSIQQYYQKMGHDPSVAALLDADSDDDEEEDDFLAGNAKDGRRLYDDHYTNDFNHAYDNRDRKDKRNPKNQRITEVLAEKLAEALQLADKTPSSSTTASIFTGKSNPNTRNTENNNNGNGNNNANKKTPEEQLVTRNLQRKDRFERCAMEGDLTRLGLHKSFFVEGVRIGWPYPSILTPQRQMAIHLVKALKNSRHVVLESPTGTGKSMALLNSLLAWQRHHAKSHWNKTVLDSGNISQLAAGLMGQTPGAETFPRIIYCSRTHSQVAQMVASLKKSPYRPRMTVLGSRDRLCIHKNIRDKNPSGQQDNDPAKRKNRVNVNTSCQMRVANTEKLRKSLWNSHDFRYDDNRPPERLPGDGEGNQGQQDSDDEDNDAIVGEGQRSSEWILKKSTKKLTCPHYRQLSSYRTSQMTRTNFIATQDEIDCCKTGGEKSRLGSHDIEDLCKFGVDPYKMDVALYRNGPDEGFGLDLGGDCMIRKIHKDTPAKFCGQLRPGDKIIQVNGKKVTSLEQIQHDIQNSSADLLELTIVRGPAAKARRTPGSTDAALEPCERDIALYRSPGEKSFGLTLKYFSSGGCEVNGFKAGPGDRTDEVQIGDVIVMVNGKTVGDYHEAVQAIAGTVNDPLRLRIRRASNNLTVVDERNENDDAEEEENLYSPHAPCPYYLSRELSKHAELLFAPYNYILDPGIRSALGIDLDGTVVVLDEAHNVEGVLTESGSGKWGEIDLSFLVSKLSFWASAAKNRENLVDMGGVKVDINEMAHELLLFVEKIVLHMRDLKATFERSSGNVGAAKAIEEYHRFHTPDNKEFEVSYHGPNGHGVHNKAVGCKYFLDSLDVSPDKITVLSKYAEALESHMNGSDKTQAGDSNGDGNGGEKSVNNTFDLLNGLISKVGMAVKTPEHFYVSCVIQANGNLDHAAGGGAENSRAGGRRFKKKPVTFPFVHPRNGHNPRAALHVCNHHKCKRATSGSATMPSYGGPGVRHGDWCDGTDAPQWEAHLVLKLLFPGLLMKDLATKCRTVVLASGSLSPLQSVCAELDLQDSDRSKTGRLQTKPRPLEANHVVNLPKQLLAVAIGTFPNGTNLTVNYNNYKHPEFFVRLGDALASVIESIPRGGVLVFFPSYTVLNKAIKCWGPASTRYGGFDNYSEHSCPEIWDRLIASKSKVIVEPTGNQDQFEQARDEYAETIKDEGSCVLLAVFRGKMSEGISFNDDNARGVICVGIPYPGAKDRGIVAKKAYNDEQRKLNKRTDLLPGQDWYAQEAYRALGQALGRVIRHEADYGTIILMDSRHCHDGSPGFTHSKLPKWMRHSVRTLSPGNRGLGHNPILQGYKGLRQEMKGFFSQAAPYTKEVLAKRIAEYEQAQEREKQGSAGHEFNSKTGGWTPAKCKPEPGGNSAVSTTVAMRVTQDSPVPPQMLLQSSSTSAPGHPTTSSNEPKK